MSPREVDRRECEVGEPEVVLEERREAIGDELGKEPPVGMNDELCVDSCVETMGCDRKIGGVFLLLR